MVYHKWYVPDLLLIKQIFRNVSISCCFLFMGASYQDTWSVGKFKFYSSFWFMMIIGVKDVILL